ncbi:40S ribosomal protein SA [Cricetulus griseus]|uniref:40S ribosomal protein SA n=1 Tax=Cricetulus griseus TaxID=10029 RepID=G3I1I4_CRIGR|nr:40S ribosomal protein SA [Cricetulus griseus]
MSRALEVLQMKEEDVLKFLVVGIHLGGNILDFQMELYIYKRKSDAIYTKHLKRTWEKLLLAVLAIFAIENPADVSIISSSNWPGRRDEVCCCHWSHSNCWMLHPWYPH